ncbi:MAG: DNA recombination protein RmuC [Bacteroidota bacterium]|nr:DNA recombination protein RmuC [Bacteroidota bacterium]
MESLYIIAAIVLGIIVGYVIRKLMGENSTVPKEEYNRLKDKFNEEEKEHFFLKKENEKLTAEIANSRQDLERLQKNNQQVEAELAAYKERNSNLNEKIQKLEIGAEKDQEFIKEQADKLTKLKEKKAEIDAVFNSQKLVLEEIRVDFKEQKDKSNETSDNFSSAKEYITELQEKNKNLLEKLDNERKDLENIREKFSNEFKVLADKVLEDKSKKFTEQNKENISNLLNPLGKEIAEFKKKVEETYTNETRERHTLKEQIKLLAQQNVQISEEAKNLTRALTGSSKSQGNWGEMILESILQNSGLQKDREYFIQDTIKDEDGESVLSETGRRMQPDVRIKYPDNQGSIIIDSKVSLTAYERYTSAEEKNEQQKALKEHLISFKKHITELADKKYHDYMKGTDFTMMFVPVEPAYIAAMQADNNLWSFAYEKRIILISPTNLIAALKLVKDMWVNKYQNDNAIEIAHRGGKLYDKFVNFAENLEDIGSHIQKSQDSYQSAIKQLSTGRGNLVRQVEQLKELGVKAEKQISSKLKEDSIEK